MNCHRGLADRDQRTDWPLSADGVDGAGGTAALEGADWPDQRLGAGRRGGTGAATAAGALDGEAALGEAALGSAFMMLTGGIDAADGKSRLPATGAGGAIAVVGPAGGVAAVLADVVQFAALRAT